MEYFDLSVEVSIKDNIDELTYEATDTVRGKCTKYRINSQSPTI